MRRLLFERLRTLGTPGTWNHIVQQTGMFSYTGLTGRYSRLRLRLRHAKHLETWHFLNGDLLCSGVCSEAG